MPAGLTIAPQNNTNSDEELTIVDPSNPLMTTPNLLDNQMLDNWDSSTHSFFTGAAVTFQTLISEDEFGQPVLIEFPMGLGVVIATMMPIDYPGADQRVLENLLLGQPSSFQTPTLGKFGLVVFMAVFVVIGLVSITRKKSRKAHSLPR